MEPLTGNMVALKLAAEAVMQPALSGEALRRALTA
jgi:hypothetical protein